MATTSPILSVSKEAGVSDLPMKVRADFSRALLAERSPDGLFNGQNAEYWLSAAIAAEAAL